MNTPLIIDYYSDILCIWGWVAQRRLDELNKYFGDNIEFKHHYIDIFGDAVNKIPTQWYDRGGYQGFSTHVIESAAPYEYTKVNHNIWSKIRPTSSANPHLIIKAIELSYSKKHSVEFEVIFRQAFFVDAHDISNMDVLFTLIDKSGLDIKKIDAQIVSGNAMAALMQDYQQAKQLNLKGSPTYILDNGRQTLYGNVGYRVLLANIDALLSKKTNDESWC